MFWAGGVDPREGGGVLRRERAAGRSARPPRSDTRRRLVNDYTPLNVTTIILNGKPPVSRHCSPRVLNPLARVLP
ncbi:hypothetical protein RR48_07520 [Papilio machaon]|uniref:Uncharacterized protein n=1 Tax=Papilio machaon TaxID=76193 RepID=A0A194RRV4_PAPMA|nr:hypothetical protein RR48_07520 [Papilio machaon]